MLIVAMDANFRLRSKLRGVVNKNHTLGPGWSYFVNNGPYSDFIKHYVDEEEVCISISWAAEGRRLIPTPQIRSCVGFQALLNILTKMSKGLGATGMAAVSCARHQMFRPLGMGDLQKGERQVLS